MHDLYRVFIEYCVFSELFKIFQTLFSLGVSVCSHTRQVENQQQNWPSSGKSQNFKEKTLYLMNSLLHTYVYVLIILQDQTCALYALHGIHFQEIIPGAK